jgi:GNAT superfamily N-acetyltransferase
MTIVVRKATEADSVGVCELLYGHMSAKIAPERWRRLLDYPWRPAAADRGCVALDGDRIVGFLGLVYADRPLGGRSARFCNICAWYLLRDYRGRGIGREMQRLSLADPHVTYTILTATAETGRAFQTRGGFSVLDSERYLVRRRSAPPADLDVVEAPDQIAAALPAGEQAVLRDHEGYNLRHLLCRRGSDSCYVVMQVKRKGEGVLYHEVMHASEPGFLVAHAPALADAILPAEKSVLAIDRRFIPGAPGWDTETMRLPRWFRSPLPAADVDHLYSEIVLLDLKL